jgi:WG containing repeat
MKVRLNIQIALVGTIWLLSLRLIAQNPPKWSSLVRPAVKQLNQKFTDSIAIQRSICDSLRNLMHDLMQSTGLDNSFVFGSRFQYIREGMSKEFNAAPIIPGHIDPKKPNTMGKVTILHVDLYRHDDLLMGWVDAKKVLNELEEKKIITFLELEYKDTLIAKNDLNTRQDWTNWVKLRIRRAIEYQTNDDPLVQAIRESGLLNDDKYQDLFSSTEKSQVAPNRKPPKQFQTLKWIIPPILEDIQDFDLSILGKDTFLLVKKDKLSGLLDRHGQIIIPIEYTNIYVKPSGWIEAWQGRKNFWFNRKGETFMEQFEKVVDLQSENAIVSKAGKWGVVNQAGAVVLPLIYDRYQMKDYASYLFFQGTESITFSDKPQTPVVQTTIPPNPAAKSIPARIQALKYDRVRLFDDQRYWYLVQKGESNGLSDTLGQLILPIEYSSIHLTKPNLVVMYKTEKTGYWYIPKNIKVEPIYDRIRVVDDSLVAIVKRDTSYGIINLKTEQLIFPFSNYSIEYTNPYFILQKEYDTSQNQYTNVNSDLTGLANREGQIIYEPDSVNIRVYSNGSYLILPHYKKSGTYALLKSADGRVLQRFEKGRTTINGSWIRYYDKNFEVKWVNYLNPDKKAPYTSVLELSEELYRISKNDQWGFADRLGKVIIPLEFAEVQASKNGLIKVKWNNKWGMLLNPLYTTSKH